MSDTQYVSASAILTAIGRAGDAEALAELKESLGHLKFDTGLIERNGDTFLPQKTVEELCYEVQTPFAGAAYDALSQIQAALGALPEETAAAPRSRRRAPATEGAAAASPASDPVAQALAGLPEPAGSTADAGTEAPASSGRGRGRGRAAAAPSPAEEPATEELQTAGQARIQELRRQADTSVPDAEPLGDVKQFARLQLALLKAQETVLLEILKAD